MRLLAGLTFMYVGTWILGIFVVLLFLVSGAARRVNVQGMRPVDSSKFRITSLGQWSQATD